MFEDKIYFDNDPFLSHLEDNNLLEGSSLEDDFNIIENN